jgi:hypothetical protein
MLSFSAPSQGAGTTASSATRRILGGLFIPAVPQ